MPVHDYEWISYGEVLARACRLGRGLRLAASMPPSRQQPAGTGAGAGAATEAVAVVVLMYAEVSVDWYLCQYGCLLERMLVIPVLAGTSQDQLRAIVATAQPSIIVTTPTRLEVVAAAIAADSEGALQPRIVLISSPPALSQQPCSVSATADVLLLSEVEKPASTPTSADASTSTRTSTSTSTSTDTSNSDDYAGADADNASSVVMLIPTSGSSGVPKLIMVTNAMMIRQFRAPRFGVRKLSNVHHHYC